MKIALFKLFSAKERDNSIFPKMRSRERHSMFGAGLTFNHKVDSLIIKNGLYRVSLSTQFKFDKFLARKVLAAFLVIRN